MGSLLSLFINKGLQNVEHSLNFLIVCLTFTVTTPLYLDLSLGFETLLSIKGPKILPNSFSPSL